MICFSIDFLSLDLIMDQTFGIQCQCLQETLEDQCFKLFETDDEDLKQAVMYLVQHNVSGTHLHDGVVYKLVFSALLQAVGRLDWVLAVGNHVVASHNWRNVAEGIRTINPNIISGRLGRIFDFSKEGCEEKMVEAWELFKLSVANDKYASMSIFHSNNEDFFAPNDKFVLWDYFFGLALFVTKLDNL